MINKLLKVFDGEKSEPFEAQKGYAFGHQAIITARNGHSISDLRTLLSQYTGLEDPNHTASIAGSKRRTFEEVGQYESDHEYNRKKRRCNSKSPSAAIGLPTSCQPMTIKTQKILFPLQTRKTGNFRMQCPCLVKLLQIR